MKRQVAFTCGLKIKDIKIITIFTMSFHCRSLRETINLMSISDVCPSPAVLGPLVVNIINDFALLAGPWTCRVLLHVDFAKAAMSSD